MVFRLPRWPNGSQRRLGLRERGRAARCLVHADVGDRVPHHAVAAAPLAGQPGVRRGGEGSQDRQHGPVVGDQPAEIEQVGQGVRSPVPVLCVADRRVAHAPQPKAVVERGLEQARGPGREGRVARCNALRLSGGREVPHAVACPDRRPGQAEGRDESGRDADGHDCGQKQASMFPHTAKCMDNGCELLANLR